MLLISLAICVDLGRDRVLVVGAERAVVVLHLQVTDALQHRVHLGEGAFRRLDERDAVLRVALRLSEAADLAAHLLRDGEAGSVVRGAVDAVAAGELLHRLRSLRRRSPSAAGAC